jgi:acetyltransferase-like isoleucine patch superfamily enzyme
MLWLRLIEGCVENIEAVMMKLLLLKLIRSPRTVTLLLLDNFFIPMWVRLNGVRAGQGCRFAGCPIVKLAPGAQIELSNNVSVNSRYNSNVAGVVHPTIFATMEPTSTIEIGEGTGISGASIVAKTGITIGKRVLIGAGACIWDTDFHPLDAETRREHATRNARSAPIIIEDEAFIGARSMILKGVRIGRGAVIGAGAVVTRDVAPGAIVAGNPARVVSSINVPTSLV